MTTMDQIHHIRALYYEQGKYLSEIVDETNKSWRTVRKYVDMTDFNVPEPKSPGNKGCSKLDPFKPVIDQWLEEDKKVPRKQRHSAKRIFHRLRKETEEFDASYRIVAEYVAAKKRELNLSRKEGFIPLEHHPGETQADFGSAEFFENGRKWSGKYLVISFPHSNIGFPQLNYGENMECLLEGLDTIFRYIGGVPVEIWFDNTSTIVTDIMKGGGRSLTDRFIRFREHYGFQTVFMNPNSGWEKGNVENKVGYCRRNFMVPVPHFFNLSDYNQKLLSDSMEDADREHYRHNATIIELFDEDRHKLLPLPATPFDLSSSMTVTTNGWGKFTLCEGKHEYSVSPAHAHTTVNLRITSSKITVLDHNYNEIVVHQRLYGGDKQQSMEWLPYLKYIALRPRSLRNSGIYDMMPDTMKNFLDNCSNTERGKILRVFSELTDRTGFDSAIQTVDQAIMYQANDAESLKNLYRRIYSDLPELPPMAPQHGVPSIAQMPVNLEAYDVFLKEGGGVNV